MTTRDELIDMFAKIIDPMAWEEPLQPKVNAPFRKRLSRKLAAEQLAALDKEGMAVVGTYPTGDAFWAFGKNGGRRDEHNQEHLWWDGDFGNFAYSWREAVAAGRIDKEPEGETD